MTHALAALFTSTFEVSGVQRFLLMFPLCLSIAVVYKTTRCDRLRDVPLAALILWVTILSGMMAVGFGFWLLYSIMT